MSQKPNQERPPLRAVQSERMVGAPDFPVPSDSVNEASVQQIWEIVRKSTDVITALREENGILRSELSALRKSEHVLQDRVHDLLDRIDQLEQAADSYQPSTKASMPPQTDRVEDGLERKRTRNSGSRSTTITITIQDNPESDLERRVSDLVHTLVEELKRGS